GLLWSISTGPTSLGNLGCPKCPQGLKILTRRSGNLNMPLFTRIIDQIYKTTSYLTLYFQGEPFMNPSFFDFVAFASEKKMYTATSTNGHYFTEANCKKAVESGLTRLIVSVDGTTQEVYEKYRKDGHLEKVVEGLELMMKTRREMKAKNPLVIMQFIVFKDNEHQIEDIQKLAKEIGVDHLALKTAQVYDYEKGKKTIPENIKYSRYKKRKDGTYEIKNKYYNHCWRSWQSSVITWDGHMVPCCFDKDAKYKVGDLKSESLKAVWESADLKIFRTNVLKKRKEIDICRNCVEGTKIWL
ncbi:MAG: SPASM domain-containing protein, partial [Bacteroidetes bacterium]|nr:SPASM domain-containing protein [Bacteroidota bacterium]